MIRLHFRAVGEGEGGMGPGDCLHPPPLIFREFCLFSQKYNPQNFEIRIILSGSPPQFLRNCNGPAARIGAKYFSDGKTDGGGWKDKQTWTLKWLVVYIR